MRLCPEGHAGRPYSSRRRPGADNETAPTEELPRPVPVTGPVESPVPDPALTPAPGTLPLPGRVAGRVSSRVLPPVSVPVTIRVAPPWAPQITYGARRFKTSPFIHELIGA
jgi:hypothetical protein